MRRLPLGSLVGLVAALALPLAAPPATYAASCPTMAGPVDVTQATIPQIRAALATGQVTSRQLTETYLARIAAVNATGPDVRAVILVAPNALAQADAADAARAAGTATGALAGIPILIKDNLDTRDLATTAGAKALLGMPPPRDAFVTARLRAAGAILLGKANMSEWATSISKRAGLSFSDVGGRLHNPYDGGETSGSSNGSAIAAAASLAAGTVGSETQGSIVLPSSINSAVGIKPTLGLVSRGGIIPLVPSFDTAGPIARTVTDATAMLGLMTGVDRRDRATAAQRGHARGDYTPFLRTGALRGARIGIPRDLAPDPMTRVRGEARISAVLRAAGATLVPMRERLFVGIPPAKGILGEFKTAVNAYLRGRGPTAPQHSLTDVIAFNRRNGRRAVRYGQDFLLKAQAMTAADERRAPALLAAYRAKAHRAIDTAMRRHHVDALLTSQIVAAMTATSAGHPHVTVPAGYSGTHPFGMIIVGRRWDEAKLIGYAYDFEQATLAHRSPATINPRFAAMCAA